jgi:aspartate carbamoyltransferase regulatory subunit
MAVQTIMEHVMEIDRLEGAKATEVFKALALLERSAVAREKLKMDTRKKVEAATKDIVERLKGKNIPQEDLNYIAERFYGITA